LHDQRFGKVRRVCESNFAERPPWECCSGNRLWSGDIRLLACRAGAKRVYAIETEDIIDVARQIAVANGCADRIQFFPSDSRKTELPERVDVIVSDIRGVLPLFNGTLASLQDAKKRFLTPNGVMIPRRDVVKAAIIAAGEIYSGLVAPWSACVAGTELSIPRRLELNTAHGVRIKFEQLMSVAQDLCTLDYLGDPSPNVSNKLFFARSEAEWRMAFACGSKQSSMKILGFRQGRNHR
jgi:type I protein arginine methyltransferase